MISSIINHLFFVLSKLPPGYHYRITPLRRFSNTELTDTVKGDGLVEKIDDNLIARVMIARGLNHKNQKEKVGE